MMMMMMLMLLLPSQSKVKPFALIIFCFVMVILCFVCFVIFAGMREYGSSFSGVAVLPVS